MNLQQYMHQYMRAHVRMNVRSNIDGWSDLEVMEAYAGLRPPAVQFPAWCASMGIALDEQPQPAPSPRADPTPEEIEKANEHAVENLSKILPFVTVEKAETKQA